MSALGVAVIAVLLLVSGYIFYGHKVQQWVGLDEHQPPPSVALSDGVDYVPAKHWTVLFGHHFASIAGAAPIIGPVIACLYWGWLPALIWIVVGGIFFGAVHDFVALAMSLENQGKSIASITHSVLGPSSRVLFSLFTLLALILIVAVFAALAGKTLANTPQVVLPTFGLIVDAVIVGTLMYKIRLSILLSTIIGLVLLFSFIVLGYFFPISLPVAHPAAWWTVILLIYGLIASVTPVNILLQPRDHLAGAVLFFGMFFGFVGLILTQPTIKAPPFIHWTAPQGSLWPMMSVTIACGAISGFHSLVASGTTSKQIPRMKDAKIIGYGTMIMESILAVLAVICVIAGLYWKTAPAGLSGLVYQDLFREGGWIKVFGAGYGHITKIIFGSFASLVGITMLKTFVMTTLDSATRITRYLTNELLGETLHIPGMKNKYVATIFVGLLTGGLALGRWQAIWPVFGASNQLIASLVLIVASIYLMQRGKGYWFTIVPAVFMLLTTLFALIYQMKGFITAETPNNILATISGILIVLALFVSFKAMNIIQKKMNDDKSPLA